MARLYEINAAIENFDFVVDEETGEVTNYGDLEALQMAREEKLENIACMIKNHASDREQRGDDDCKVSLIFHVHVKSLLSAENGNHYSLMKNSPNVNIDKK